MDIRVTVAVGDRWVDDDGTVHSDGRAWDEFIVTVPRLRMGLSGYRIDDEVAKELFNMFKKSIKRVKRDLDAESKGWK